MVPTLNQLVEDFVAQIKRDAADGVSLSDFFRALTALVWLVIQAAETLDNPGDEKKQIVLSAVGFLADQVLPLVVLPGPFAWLGLFVRPLLRSVALHVADGAIESLLARVRASTP